MKFDVEPPSDGRPVGRNGSLSMASARAARFVFGIAGVYGLLVLPPFYFLASTIARATPGGLTHEEYYYGFIGCALVFQIVYLMIARAPLRYRPLMPVGVLAKLSFFVPVAILWLLGRLVTPVLAFASIDFLLACAFAWAWLRTRGASQLS